jgi:competence protein ComEA
MSFLKPLVILVAIVSLGWQLPSLAQQESSSFTASQEQAATININSASVEELVSLTGIGPAKAQAIVEYRDANGQFRTKEDLLQVSGIGTATLEKIAGQISL